MSFIEFPDSYVDSTSRPSRHFSPYDKDKLPQFNQPPIAPSILNSHAIDDLISLGDNCELEHSSHNTHFESDNRYNDQTSPIPIPSQPRGSAVHIGNPTR